MRHKYHPADRYIHSGSGAARSAAFCWSVRDGILSQFRGTLSLVDRRSDGGIEICNPSEKEYGRGRSGDLRHIPT